MTLTPYGRIRHEVEVIMAMAEHSKSMSVGAKAIIKNHGLKILEEVKVLENDNQTTKTS